MRGWAIEVRINAEDPFHGFVPSTGTIRNLRAPGGPWVRMDAALYRGMEVGLDYDPMLAKLIVWGPDRASAIARMVRALQELNVGGVRTGAPAALLVLEDERFRGASSTRTSSRASTSRRRGRGEDALVAAAAAIHRHRMSRRRALETSASTRRAWLERSRSTRAPDPPRTPELATRAGDGGGAREVLRHRQRPRARGRRSSSASASSRSRSTASALDARLRGGRQPRPGRAVASGSAASGVSIEGDEREVAVAIAGHLYAVEIEDERERAAHAAERADAQGRRRGQERDAGDRRASCSSKEGDVVEQGQPLLVLEAMKMQNEIAAPAAGVVRAMHVRVREAVQGGAKLLTIE